MDCLELFKHKSMLCTNRDSLNPSFLIYINLISFSGMIALAANSNTILNKSKESGHFYLIPDLLEVFFF
jgi:hypothetical protein